jgi:hypothetical protein
VVGPGAAVVLVAAGGGLAAAGGEAGPVPGLDERGFGGGGSAGGVAVV